MPDDLRKIDQVNTFTTSLLEEGYVIIKNAIPKTKLKRLTKELDVYFDLYPNSSGVFYGDKTVRFGSVFAKSKSSHDLACDTTIIGIMKKILKPQCDRVQINLTQAIGIHPGESHQVPHRDDSMFPFQHANSQCMINCMWALTPFNKETGGTRIWPGSHLGDFDPNIDLDLAIHPELEPGDVLLYLGSTVHSGGQNLSDQTRKGLVISYSLGWLRQAENQYLANPPEVAVNYRPDLQKLIGYSAHRPNLGWYEGEDPSLALREVNQKSSGFRSTQDLLPPELEAMAKAYQEAQRIAS